MALVELVGLTGGKVLENRLAPRLMTGRSVSTKVRRSAPPNDSRRVNFGLCELSIVRGCVVVVVEAESDSKLPPSVLS